MQIKMLTDQAFAFEQEVAQLKDLLQKNAAAYETQYQDCMARHKVQLENELQDAEARHQKEMNNL